MTVTNLPDEFDVDYYRLVNPDLASFTNEQAQAHYTAYGIDEGRIASKLATRDQLKRCIPRVLTLEIGPYCRPFLSGSNVRYFDVLDSDGIKSRLLREGLNPASPDLKRIPHIHYVEPNGDLSVVRDKFGAVFSSHSIEHQPDIIRHLQGVSRILNGGGRYYLCVPNKLYCFDHFIAESTIADVLDAYEAQRKVHTLGNVIRHRALTTHNESVRHWAGDHKNPGYDQSIPHRAILATQEFRRANGGYVDVHAWFFTPASFRILIDQLLELELTDLYPERVYNSVRGSNEFITVLRKKP